MSMSSTFSLVILTRIVSINSLAYYDSEEDRPTRGQYPDHIISLDQSYYDSEEDRQIRGQFQGRVIPLDQSEASDSFQPSVEFSILNYTTLSSVPIIQPRDRDRLAISFDEEFADIGNIDFTQPSVSPRGARGVTGERRENPITKFIVNKHIIIRLIKNK